MKHRELLLRSIGTFFIAVGIVAIAYAAYWGREYQALWFCYIGSILMGVAVLSRNKFILLAQINILLIPAIIWAIDFLSLLFFNYALWGITDYFFAEPLFAKIISLQHLYNTPLALIALFLLGNSDSNKKWNVKRAWQLGFIEGAVVFILARIYSIREENVNWVFYSGFSIPVNLPYTIVWFLGFFLMIFLTNYALVKLTSSRWKE